MNKLSNMKDTGRSKEKLKTKPFNCLSVQKLSTRALNYRCKVKTIYIGFDYDL